MSAPPREPPEAEFRNLVDAVIDGQATPEEQQRLEDRMRVDPTLLNYYADRLVLHAELAESVRPLRVELVQQRRIVIEGEGPGRQVLFGETHEARIGGRQNLIALPDRTPVPWYRRMGILAGLALAALILAAFGLVRMLRPAAASASPPPVLVLRNGGFEDDRPSDDPAGRSESILEWDDYFPCPDSGVYDLEKYSHGKLKAHGGRNAVRLRADRPAWITQRLNLADGSPLLARKGMVVQVHGWALLDAEPSRQDSIEISLRHVASTHPTMIQYVADSGEITLKGGTWQPFSIRFALSPLSLVTAVKHKEWGDTTTPTLDIEGKALSLSIDNFYNPTVILDDVSAELMDPGNSVPAK